MKLKKILALVLCLCMLAGLAACGSTSTDTKTDTSAPAASADDSAPAASGDSAPAASSKTQLNVATELTNSTMDPAGSSYNWFPLRWGVCETLFKFNDDMTVGPWLAQSAEVADDGLTWTIKLTDGVVFSNGEPMTATKVVESIERLYDATDPEKGGSGEPQGFMTYTSISADDAANTVTIVTTVPTIDLPGCLAYPWTAILDVTGSEGIDVDTYGFVSTGAYVVTYNDPESNIQLAKNTNYWDGEVPFETVNIMKLGEASTRAMALQDGSADFAINISAADRAVLAADDSYVVDVTGGNRIGMCFINFQGVLGNDALRQAVLMAIDGEAISAVTVNGAYSYTNNSVLPGYEVTNPYTYDPDAAMKLLDDAGIVDSDGDGYRELDGKNIELNYIGSSSRQQDVIGQAHAAQIEEIGIKVNFSIPESAGDARTNLGFDLIFNNEVTMHTGDPGNFMRHWYGTHDTVSSNFGDYHSDAYDALYEQLEGEFDAAKRQAIFAQLAQILVDDAAAIAYGSYSFNICSAKTVNGVHSATCDYYWVTKDITPAA